MAEVAPFPAPAAAPAKAAKKKASKPKKAGPSVSELILKTVSASKERSGVSAAALKKALAAGGYEVDKNKARINTAIKSLVIKEILVQTKGTGASGSFKMSKKVETKAKKPAKKAPPKAKKPAAAKKSKSAAAKKLAAAKKSPSQEGRKEPQEGNQEPQEGGKEGPRSQESPREEGSQA